MSTHYYSPEPNTASRPERVQIELKGVKLSFVTDSGVFSKGKLDKGTEVLIEALPDRIRGRVLEVGCGWGPIGLFIKALHQDCDVTLVDINRRAVELTEHNMMLNHLACTVVQGDGLTGLDGAFDLIVTNPPIRAGKDVIYKIFADSSARLSEGGALYTVIRKRQGAPSALNYLKTIFKKAEIIEREAGYWVIKCTN